MSAHKIAPLHDRCESKDQHHKCFKSKSTSHIHTCICDRTWGEKVQS